MFPDFNIATVSFDQGFQKPARRPVPADQQCFSGPQILKTTVMFMADNEAES